MPAPCGRSPRTACGHKARSANTSVRVAFPDSPRSLPEMMKSARFLACPPPETRTLPKGASSQPQPSAPRHERDVTLGLGRPHRVSPRSCAFTELLPSSCASFVGPSAERTIEGRSDEACDQEIIAIIASDFMGLEVGPRNRSNGVGKRYA